MTDRARRGIIVIGAAVAATAVLSAAGVGTVSAAREGAPVPAQCEDPDSTALDGFTLGYLPAGIGTLVSDFDYDWNDVAFRTRVWERGPDSQLGYRVDLRVKVLRSPRLVDGLALRAFLTEYHEQDPASWELAPWSGGGHHGFSAPDRVFFLARPGVAVEVDVDRERVDQAALHATAEAVAPC